MRLDYTAKAFARAAGLYITKAERRLAGVAGKLDALSPLKVMSRGYAIPVEKTGAVGPFGKRDSARGLFDPPFVRRTGGL